jgi:hypothetical protein
MLEAQASTMITLITELLHALLQLALASWLWKPNLEPYPLRIVVMNPVTWVPHELPPLYGHSTLEPPVVQILMRSKTKNCLVIAAGNNNGSLATIGSDDPLARQ